MPLRTKTTLIVDELLKVIALSGVAAMTVIAPNSLIALEKPLEKIIKALDKSVDSRKLAYYTKRLEVVEITEVADGSYEIALSKKGQKRILKASFENLQIRKPHTWDAHWRVVVFDIPEEFKVARQFLVDKLKSMNFYMLQRSVWVHPFPCLEQVALIKHVLPEISSFVSLIDAESIDQHNRLVKHFHKLLPL